MQIHVCINFEFSIERLFRIEIANVAKLIVAHEIHVAYLTQSRLSCVQNGFDKTTVELIKFILLDLFS